MRTKSLSAAVSLPALAIALSAHAQPAQAQSSTDAPVSSVATVVVDARRLNAARELIQPELGASTYTITSQAIEALPGGENVGLNQVVLQSPSVVQDSFGQLHVRGDHADIQYRLNGVILPEGLSQFGQALNPRLAGSVRLITGALPAQYGLRTAGIVDIQTKSSFDNEGQVSVYGGSRGEYQPSFEYGGSSGATNVFVSASYLRSQLGIESPDGRPTPSHDRTDQLQGFAYVEHILSPQDRLSLIGGVTNQRFQIPDRLGLQPDLGLTVNGVASFPSERLDETQREATEFAIASYQHTTDRSTVQASLFSRYSSLTYRPDAIGDLLYGGISQRARKRDSAAGLQLESVFFLSAAHTLRAGAVIQGDHSWSKASSQVLPVDVSGVSTADEPLLLADDSRMNARTYSAYLQDEWKLGDSFTLNYGLRFDEADAYRDERQLSPRVNFVWTPADKTTVHGGFSRYFTPAPFELVGARSVGLFQGTTAAAPGVLDTAPFAERSSYLDLGIQQRLIPGLTLGLDSYYRKSTDMLDDGQFGAPIILTPFNYAHGKIYGVELSANYVKGAFSTYLNFAYSRARARTIVSSQFNFDPTDLAYLTDHYIFVDHDQTYTASGGVAYSWRGTRLSADAIYGSGLRADGEAPNGRALNDYLTVNLGVSHRFEPPVVKAIEARFDVLNVGDARYVIRDGTGIGVGAPQFGARRAYYVGLTKFF